MARQARLYQVESIILGRRDYGEADQVIICLTPEGRMDFLAKGSRKFRSRKSGHLELFARTKLLLSRVQNSWDIISQAEATILRPRLQDDFGRGTYARYVTELVVRFFEREANAGLFELLDYTLTMLEYDDAPELLVRWYEQRLLVLAGFRPQWDVCVGEREGRLCEVPLKPRPTDERPYGIDPERGGALCPQCLTASRQEPGIRPLSPSALSWLQALQHREYEALKEFDFPESAAQELARVMEHYIAHHLEYRPTTLRLMERGKPYG
ncbi:MAG: DNA repair protein RecO [Anaerolineae bacterium]